MLSEEQAFAVVTAMAQHEVLDLIQDVALTAADLSLQHDLGMADSLILAHAQLNDLAADAASAQASLRPW